MGRSNVAITPMSPLSETVVEAGEKTRLGVLELGHFTATIASHAGGAIPVRATMLTGGAYVAGRGGDVNLVHRERVWQEELSAMRTILAVLVVLSVLAGAGSVSADTDAKAFFDQQQRQSGGGM